MEGGRGGEASLIGGGGGAPAPAFCARLRARWGPSCRVIAARPHRRIPPITRASTEVEMQAASPGEEAWRAGAASGQPPIVGGRVRRPKQAGQRAHAPLLTARTHGGCVLGRWGLGSHAQGCDVPKSNKNAPWLKNGTRSPGRGKMGSGRESHRLTHRLSPAVSSLCSHTSPPHAGLHPPQVQPHLPGLFRRRLCGGPRGGRPHLHGVCGRDATTRQRKEKKNRNAFRPRLPPRRRPPHTYNALSLLSSPSQGCGLVVEGHAIDERSEWRTFGDGVRRGREEETRGEEARPLARACPLTST